MPKISMWDLVNSRPKRSQPDDSGSQTGGEIEPENTSQNGFWQSVAGSLFPGLISSNPRLRPRADGERKGKGQDEVSGGSASNPIKPFPGGGEDE